LTALASAIRPLWSLLEEYGQDPGPLFQRSGIEPEALKNPNARLPVAACNAVWLRASSRISDPCFGLKAAQHWHPSMFGALGYAWLASTSLRTALGRLQRYTDLVLEGSSVQVHESRGGEVNVRLSYQGSPYTIPALADALLALVLRLCRLNCGESLNPMRATLFHSSPAEPGPYFACFRCPVEFDAPHDGLTFAKAVVDQPLPGANPNLAQLNDQEIIRHLARLNRDRITERVQAAIIEQLPSGNVSNETVAKALNVSSRTLHRQLQDEGTSFKALLDETRRELAKTYINDDRINLTEVAFMLGFAEPSSFTRACRRWTGKAPSAMRGQRVHRPAR
jgi:AraC-like DNA-binding protein